MSKLSFILACLVCVAAAGAASAEGMVTKINRPQVATFDETGAPAGMVAAKDIKLPAPVVASGKGASVGIKIKDKVLFLRGLDVQTEGLNAKCEPVQTASRDKGAAYAASNMGLGAPCKK